MSGNQTRVRFVAITLLLLGAVAAALPAAAAETPRPLVLVLDASGSMWGRIGGEPKIVIAREVLSGLVEQLPAESSVGLVAYGHRREGDCGDIETVTPLEPLDRGRLTAAVEALNPKGKTPITAALEQAFALVRGQDRAATVILVSDGLETCGGDPCAAVRDARDAGVDLVTHVVGFGIEEGDVSQLECVAQAGGGLYFPVEDAGGLAAALEQAVEAPAEPGAWLSVAAVAGDDPVDALVRVTVDGEEVAGGRTYTGAETNPRVFGLPAGSYDVEVAPVRIEGVGETVLRGVEIRDGETTERRVDFSPGELAVKVTRNGGLSDAVVSVRRAGETRQVAGGRTYVSESSNPRVFNLAAGSYDVEVRSAELEGGPTRQWRDIVVEGGGWKALEHEFASGTLRIGATSAGELVDAVVSVLPGGGGSAIAGGRTYTSETSNPRSFVLAPGSYRVTVRPVRLQDAAPQEITVELGAGETVERIADF